MKNPPVSKKVDLQKVPSRRSSVLARYNGDGSATVLNLGRDNSVYFLDGMACQIFMHVNGRASWETIRDSAAKRNSVSATRVNSHLRAFIRWLHKERLIDEL